MKLYSMQLARFSFTEGFSATHSDFLHPWPLRRKFLFFICPLQSGKRLSQNHHPGMRGFSRNHYIGGYCNSSIMRIKKDWDSGPLRYSARARILCRIPTERWYRATGWSNTRITSGHQIAEFPQRCGKVIVSKLQ